MKVYIAPYVSNHSFKRIRKMWFKIRHGKTEFMIEDSELDHYDHKFDKFIDFLMKIMDKYYEYFPIKSRHRKIKVRIDDYDVWGMDETLSYIIVPMLQKLKSKKVGIPYLDRSDIPSDIILSDIDNEHTTETKIMSEQGWDWVMDEMIWAMQQCQDHDEGSLYYHDSYGDDEKVEPFILGDTIFVTAEEVRKIGKFNQQKYQVYTDRVNNGTQLFGKYFRHLWD